MINVTEILYGCMAFGAFWWIAKFTLEHVFKCREDDAAVGAAVLPFLLVIVAGGIAILALPVVLWNIGAGTGPVLLSMLGIAGATAIALRS